MGEQWGWGGGGRVLDLYSLSISSRKSRESSGTVVYCRRERKVFETHQQEAKTARDKRDREEIEQLKKQVQCLTLEHRQYWLLGDRSILAL